MKEGNANNQITKITYNTNQNITILYIHVHVCLYLSNIHTVFSDRDKYEG